MTRVPVRVEHPEPSEKDAWLDELIRVLSLQAPLVRLAGKTKDAYHYEN